jgi:hypothetical protein
MSESVKKIIFDYSKKEGETSVRTILSPKFLKESSNYFKDFEKEQVKYVSGYEIQKEGLTNDEIKEYEECVLDYFNLVIPTMDEYLNDLGLDSSKVKQKTFKKDGISNPSIIKE